MYQATTTEAFVLYAIRTSPHSLSVRAVMRLTGLPLSPASEAIDRLQSEGLIATLEGDHEICYHPVALPTSPLIPGYRAWLRVFCSRPILCETWDTDAMTFDCCGLVILTAVVSGTRDAQVLARLSTFPEGFVGWVLEMMDDLDVWWSDRLFDLERTILQNSSDFKDVDDSLHGVKEEFWNAATCASPAMLRSLHGGRQYGGQVDPSLEESAATGDGPFLVV